VQRRGDAEIGSAAGAVSSGFQTITSSPAIDLKAFFGGASNAAEEDHAHRPDDEEHKAAPVPRFLFPLFYLVEIRHRQLLQSQSCTRGRAPISRRVPCQYSNCVINYISCDGWWRKAAVAWCGSDRKPSELPPKNPLGSPPM
jgi:hypothetical protein